LSVAARPNGGHVRVVGDKRSREGGARNEARSSLLNGARILRGRGPGGFIGCLRAYPRGFGMGARTGC